MQMKATNRRMRGITLIELMVVVLIVGILAAFAYPSYQSQARKAKRADAKTELMETAQELERCLTRFGRYNDPNCPVTAATFPFDSPEGHYELTAPTLNAVTFTLDATPQGPQADDTECGILRLTSAGVQGSQGGNTDPNDCW